jgi:hypothetical protein
VGVRDAMGRPLSSRVVLEHGNGRERGRATSTRDATFRVTAPQDGDLLFNARAVGLARLWTRPAATRLPVASYREAVERGYVTLRRRVLMADAASPGDLMRALEARLPGAANAHVRDAARLFEVADYSETPVDRAFYHTFARARLAVEDALLAEEERGA